MSKKRSTRRHQHGHQIRNARRQSDRELLGALSALGDPLQVAHAITSSPLGMHRYMSLGPAVQLAIRHHPYPGTANRQYSSGARDIFRLSQERVGRSIIQLEDTIPLDPRFPVLGTFFGTRYKLYPGILERPISLLRTTELLSNAIDSELVGELEFGLEDYTTLCLTHTSRAIEAIESSWPSDPLPEPYSDPAVTPAEVSASARTVNWLATDLSSSKQRAALRWASTGAAALRMEKEQDLGDTCFGITIATRTPNSTGLLALPLPYIAEAWELATRILTSRAHQLNPTQTNKRWAKITRAEVARTLDRIHDLPPIRLCQVGAVPLLLIQFGQRHYMALAVHSTLETNTDTIRDEQALKTVAPGATISSQGTSIMIPSDADVVHTLIIAAPAVSFVGVTEELALLTLDDLRWIGDTCETAFALWAFCNDLQNRPGEARLLGFEPINIWQFWRSNGQALHRAGRPPSGMLFAPHQAAEEWERASTRTQLEVALKNLDLPHSSSFDAIDVQGDRVKLFRREPMEMWEIALIGARGFGGLALGTIPADLRELGDNLPGTLCWAAVRLKDPLEAAMAAIGIKGLIFRFTYDPDAVAGTPPLRLDDVEVSTGTIFASWNERLAEHEIENPGYLQRTVGEILCRGLSLFTENHSHWLDDLRNAYAGVPPVFTLQVEHVPQKARNLTPATPAPAWSTSEALRRLGEYLLGLQIPPGLISGIEAMRLETDTIAPWLLQEIRNAMTSYSARKILNRACAELESVTCRRDHLRRDRRRREFIATADGTDSYDSKESDLSRQSKILEAVIELALATESSSSLTPDEIEWLSLLGICGLYVDATIRSDSLRWGLSGESTRITESYELEVEPSATSRIDSARYYAERLAHARDQGAQSPESSPDHPLGSESDSEPNSRAGALDAVIPNIAELDKALTEDCGCSVTTLINTCEIIKGWQVSREQPIVEVNVEILRSAVIENYEVSEREAESSIRQLSLTPANLRTEGVQPWRGRKRDNRIATRPLIRPNGSSVILLPWTAQTTQVIFLRYLTEGLSPWPVKRLEGMPAFRRALDQFRLKCTKLLEDRVDSELHALGWKLESRIKQHQAVRLGLQNLPGEIDHVVGHDDSDTLWVVDDKDLGEVFSIGEMSNGIDLFEKPGGEYDKLAGKIEAVERDTESVANALGLTVRPRQVKGLFVTSRPVPAAYSPAAKYQFVVAAELSSVFS